MKAQAGVWTAIVTPFQANGSVEWTHFDQLVQRQIEAGVAGIIPCGTTGEAPTLSRSEKEEAIRRTLEACQGKSTQVFAGTGSNCTRSSIEFSKWASDQGVDGILVVTPYYNKPSQAGMLQHFEAIANSIDCDLMLYNVPSRTAISLTLESMIQLARHPKISSIKEASGDPNLVAELYSRLEANSLDLDIFSGDDATFLDSMIAGGKGVVSVASNLLPRQIVEIADLQLDSRTDEAKSANLRFEGLYRDLFIESNPSPLKFALSKHNLCLPHVRLPLVEMTEESQHKLSQTLNTLDR